MPDTTVEAPATWKVVDHGYYVDGDRVEYVGTFDAALGKLALAAEGGRKAVAFDASGLPSAATVERGIIRIY